MNGRASPTKIIVLALAALGLATLAALSVWGFAKIAGKVKPFDTLASLISSITLRKEVIQPTFVISASSNAVGSGKAVEITWQYDKYETGGVYVLNYACVDGVELSLATKEKINCNSTFNLWARNSIAVIPTLKGINPVPVSLEIGYLTQGKLDVVAKANINLTITPSDSGDQNSNSQEVASTGSGSAQTPGNTQNSFYLAGNGSHNSGPTDLSVEIVDLGIINESTNVFTHATSVNSANLRAGIVFDIKNNGGVVSQSWIFTAQLPAANGAFRSDIQDPLTPGTRVRFTLGFKDIMDSGNNPIIIRVDPDNQISDKDRTNNIASTTIYRGY